MTAFEISGAPTRVMKPLVDTVAVALDGSTFALHALAPAGWAAEALGARVELLEVVDEPTHEAAARSYLHLMAAPHDASTRVLVDTDVVDALALAIGTGDHVLPCFATHGRGRSAAVIGSIAAGVLAAIDTPVLLVGPQARVPAPDVPILVALGGHDEEDEVLDVALGWAAALERSVLAVTVIEPAPPSMTSDHPTRRSIGPADIGAYQSHLLQRGRNARVPIAVATVEDAVSVASGLEPWFRKVGPALTVVGCHRRQGVRRLLRGDHAASLAAVAPGPVLAVELGLRR